MYDYLIADIRLRCDRDLVAMGLRGFKPFATECNEDAAHCTLNFVDKIDVAGLGSLRTLSESYIADSNSDSSFYATKEGYLYSIVSRSDNHNLRYFISTAQQITLLQILNPRITSHLLFYALVYGLCSAQCY